MRTKDVIVVLFILCLIGTALFAGGQEEKSTADSEEQINLTFWYGSPEDKGPGQMIEEYERLNPNVNVDFVQLAFNDEADIKLTTALMSGESVDVYTPTRNEMEKIKNGLALNLTPYLEREGMDLEQEVGPEAKAWLYNGEYYSIPTYTYSTFVYLNLDMFEEAGIEPPTNDWTIDDYRRISKQLTTGSGNSKRYGLFITSNWQYFWLYSYFGSFNEADLFNEDYTAANFDDPAVIKALELYIEMSEEDGSVPTFAETVAEKYFPNQMFLGEKAAMVVSQDYLIRNIKDREANPSNIRTGFVELPHDPEFDTRYRLFNVSGSTMINPKSDNIEASWDFLEWFFHDGCKHVASLSGKLPAYKGFTTEQVTNFMLEGVEDLIDGDSFNALFAARSDNRPISQKSTGPAEAKQLLIQYGERALIGEMSPAEAMREADRKADELLSKR